MAFNTTATAISANGSTGGTCQQTGPYKSGGSVIIFLKRGDTFPADPVSGKKTSWTMSVAATTFN